MSLLFVGYVCAEVSAGGESPPPAQTQHDPVSSHATGWVLKFLIRLRGGKPSQVGYVCWNIGIDRDEDSELID